MCTLEVLGEFCESARAYFSWCQALSSRYLDKHIKTAEIAIENVGGIPLPQPALHHGLIDATEIRCVGEIVAFGERGQAGDFPVMPAFDL